VGGIIRRIVVTQQEKQPEDIDKKQTRAGVLMSSGLIAGEGVMGVLIAGYAFFMNTTPEGVSFGLHGIFGEIVSFSIFLGLGFFLYKLATKKREGS
jgi:hypothetical protein